MGYNWNSEAGELNASIDVAEEGHHAIDSALSDYSQINVVYNSGKENAEQRARAIQERFQSNDLTVDLIESHAHIDGNSSIIEAKSELGRQDLWAIIGGDGTVSNFLGAAALTGLESPVLVMPEGYANDIAHMLYDKRDYADPFRAIATGRIAPLRPLDVRISRPDSPAKADEIMFFSSFGGPKSGDLAKLYDSKGYREKRESYSSMDGVMLDMGTALDSIGRTPQITMTERADNSEGSSSSCVEILFTNGQLMSKYIRFRNLDLLQDRAGRLEVEKDRLSHYLSALGRAATGKFTTFGLGETQAFQIESKLPFRTHCDGEWINHSSGVTSFRVQLSERTVPVITSHRSSLEA